MSPRGAGYKLEQGMLVLTQREGEILEIGDDIRIYIKRIKGNWVRLCIDAPSDVSLQRIPAPMIAPSEEDEEVQVVRINRRR